MERLVKIPLDQSIEQFVMDYAKAQLRVVNPFVLIRIFEKERINEAMRSGTDRDKDSKIYFFQEEFTKLGLNPGDVTFLTYLQGVDGTSFIENLRNRALSAYDGNKLELIGDIQIFGPLYKAKKGYSIKDSLISVFSQD